MRWWRVIIVAVVVIVLGLGVYGLVRERMGLEEEVSTLRSEFNSLEAENKDLVSQIEYFENPENLLKKVKEQFNYREQGEGLIIIVPNKEATE